MVVSEGGSICEDFHDRLLRADICVFLPVAPAATTTASESVRHRRRSSASASSSSSAARCCCSAVRRGRTCRPSTAQNRLTTTTTTTTDRTASARRGLVRQLQPNDPRNENNDDDDDDFFQQKVPASHQIRTRKQRGGVSDHLRSTCFDARPNDPDANDLDDESGARPKGTVSCDVSFRSDFCDVCGE